KLQLLTDHKAPLSIVLNWTDEAMIHFNRLKQALTTIPALGRPQALIVQIIGQLLFLYKQLDTIVQGMPSCLRALAVAAVIEQMAKNMVLSHTLILTKRLI
uniref:Uncharacterized protein n=1 Tax=Cyprinus carpio TaxID=7962 RepID=A0A8C1IU26_CYPCA